ncbi:DUF397 domain-containing protein [Kitasatospora sp. NPDC004615]|uniref:DUF397 domain-containing protein n=1 Tax=Kitasatospora sp. NPDC004615 TaxID=3364017 RepID=UPI00368CB033
MSEINLYVLPIEGATFVRQCGGNLTSEDESCVGLAAIPGLADGFVLRDTKAEGAGRELRFTRHELDAFAVKWVEGRALAV